MESGGKTKSPRADGSHGAAFTLIELMVVLVLIGIMTALIIPEMRGTYGDARLRAGVRELVGACGIASSRAVSLNQPHRLVIDARTGRFRLERKVRSSGSGTGFVDVRDVAGTVGALDERITVRLQRSGDEESTMPPDDTSLPAGARNSDVEPPGGEGIGFYPDGTADRGEIQLRDTSGIGMALRINPITARVRIVELKRE